MEFWKRPVLRVPLVLCGLGILMRRFDVLAGFVWGRIQIASGSTEISAGPVTIVSTVIDCLLFWLAGWFFVRGLTRRQVFWSASTMVLINAALLAAEQISWAGGWYFPWVYHLYALAEGSRWVFRLLSRIFNTVSIPLAVVGVFTPCLYLIFAKKRTSPQEIRPVGKPEQKRGP